MNRLEYEYDDEDDYEDDEWDIGELELVGAEDDDYDDDDEDEEGGDELAELLALIEGDPEEVGARGRRRKKKRKAVARRRVALPRRRGKPVRVRRSQPATRVIYVPQSAEAVRPRPKQEVVACPRPERRSRQLLLGGRSTQGGTAGQLLIPTTVQEFARVDRLFITGVDASGDVINPAEYSIADIKVGTKSQFAALPPLPGIMFQADATGQGARLGLDTIQTGTDFTVIIADAPAGSTFTWGAYARALR